MASSSASPRLNPPPPRKPAIDTGVPAMDAEEEDALTRPHHPAGLYALKLLHQQRQQDRIGFQSVGPRTIGGMRRLAASTNISNTNHKSCSCKGSSKCLTLYCPCFARGRLCQSCTCSSCVNDGGPTDHVVKRTRAVVDHLTRYPYAFRPSAQDVKDAAQQMRKTRDDDDHDDDEEPGIRIFSHPQATESEYQELPASFYSEPLGPGAGLATTRVHPKVFRDSNNNDNDNNHAKRPRSPSPKKEQPSRTKQRLVRKKKVLWNTTTRREHVLVTTMAAETSLEAFERYQQEALQDTLHQLSQCVNGNSPDDNDDDNETETIADAVETMRQDLQSIQTAIEAAELDVMTRLYKAKQPHGLANSGGGRLKEGDDEEKQANNEGDKDAEEALYCHDDLPPPLASTAYVKEEDLRERTLLAAQESALLQETARIIRRKARELCERRLNSATSQE